MPDLLAALPLHEGPHICSRCGKETWRTHVNWKEGVELCEDCWMDDADAWLNDQEAEAWRQHEQDLKECRG